MSRTRRNFSAKFKSELVIELLKGEKDLNTIATENNIQPNLLRNWKKEFLDKASVVFNDTREDNLKEKLALERKEKAEYAKKVGLLTKRWFIILRQKKRIKKYQKGRVKNFRLFHTPFFYLFIKQHSVSQLTDIYMQGSIQERFIKLRSRIIYRASKPLHSSEQIIAL